MIVPDDDIDALFQLKDESDNQDEAQSGKSQLSEPMFLDEDEDGNLSF